MKYLKKLETYLPYIAIIIVFLSKKNQLDSIIYLITSILFSFYFFPVRIILSSSLTEKTWVEVLISVLSANIFILVLISLINPEQHIVKTLLGISGILCIGLLVYEKIFEKLSIRLFTMLLGFNILASVSILMA